MDEVHTSDPGSSSSTRRLPIKNKKFYDTAFKLRVIEYAEKHNNREAGRNFNVGESSVRLEEAKE